MRNFRGLVVAFALVSLAGVAFAEDDDAGFGPVTSSVEAGFFLGGYFPPSDQEFYDPHVTDQKELDSLNVIQFVGVEVEGLFSPTKTEEANGDAPLYGARAHVIGQYPGRITPFAVAGLGVSRVSSGNNVLGRDTDALAHLGLGAKLYVTESMSVRVDARYLRGPGARKETGTNHYELLVGLAWTLFPDRKPEPAPEPEPDPDGDGFVGDTDKCPQEKGAAPDGCPLRDSDGDLIFDDRDRCPTEAETFNGWEDSDGCPDAVPDSDGDGLDDNTDKCKDQPEDVDNFEDADGCPDPDNDGDGVTDVTDACPSAAGPAENRGCPDTDRDGDGVVDRVDNCPDEPGTVEHHGCKKKQLVVLTQTQLKILDRVFFRTGKALIQWRSRKLLDNVAKVLTAHPEIARIRVEGHTDNVGKPEGNKVLSQKRADAVVAYLVKKGVPAERLEAVGFGQDTPVDDNGTKAGRANNRRVEFKIVGAGSDAPQ